MHNDSIQAPTAARYVHSLCQLLVSAKVSIDDLLAGTDLQPELLQAPDQFVSHYTLDRFLQNIEQYTDERFPGVLLGHHLNISAHGAAGYAGLTTANARQAIEVAIRFFPLITSLASLSLRTKGKRTHLVITPAPGVSERTEQFVVHTLLASFDVMGSFLVGDLELHAGLAFAEQADLKARLGSTVRDVAFNQTGHSLSLPRDSLELPFALADRVAHTQAIAQCEWELQRLNSQTSVMGRVLKLLRETGALSQNQERLAAQLGMSSRTLHRRLLKEGISYRALVLQARIDCAKHYLINKRLGATETAYRLGYQDSANFSRAFRQATGMTPSEFAKAGPSGTRQPAPSHRPETDPPAPSSSPRNT